MAHACLNLVILSQTTMTTRWCALLHTPQLGVIHGRHGNTIVVLQLTQQLRVETGCHGEMLAVSMIKRAGTIKSLEVEM